MGHQQTQTNRHDHDPLTNEQLKSFVSELVFTELQNSLWYRIDCVDCEDAGKKLAVATDTVREMIKRGELAASKVGNNWKIRLIDIDAYLTRHATMINIDKRYRRRN